MYFVNGKYSIIAQLYIIVLSFVLISGCIDPDTTPHLNIDGFSTMKAYSILQDWNNDTYGSNMNIMIHTINSVGDKSNGFAEKWQFAVIIINSTEGYGYGIDITHEEKLDVFYTRNIAYENLTEVQNKVYITNWTIDSDEAYNIAINNTEISEYLNDTGNRAWITSFSLRNWSQYAENTTAVWEILWNYSGALGFGQSHIKIEIDASTGEVLYTGPT